MQKPISRAHTRFRALYDFDLAALLRGIYIPVDSITFSDAVYAIRLSKDLPSLVTGLALREQLCTRDINGEILEILGYYINCGENR